MHAVQKAEKPTAATPKTSDADLQQTVTAAFAKARDLKIEGLRISVKNARAILKGSAENNEAVQKATAIAERIHGLQGVENSITATSSLKKGPSSIGNDRPAGKGRTPAGDDETLITM